MVLLQGQLLRRSDTLAFLARESEATRPGRALLLSLALLAVFCLPAQAQKKKAAPAGPRLTPIANSTNVNVEASPQLFAVMCALHAAGFDKGTSSAGFHPVRAELRAELLRRQGPAADALRKYYREHELESPAATLSRYISFALVAEPPPKFGFTLRPDELPPDVRVIEDFGEPLAGFYREAQIDRVWARVQNEYDPEIGRVSSPTRQIVFTTTGYLRELLKPQGARTFTVLVEPLVGSTTSFRNYGDHYFLVLNPGGDLPLDEIRHAFLHFLLDPLPLRYKGAVLLRKPLLNYAGRAPRLSAEYRDDFTAFFTECLVRAVELRVRRLPAAKLTEAIDQAEGDGFVLVRPIVRELLKFEQAEPAMSFYFADLVRGIDVAEESKRLESVKFAPATPVETPGTPSGGAGASEIETRLAEGERQIAAHNADAAIAAFQEVLVKEPEQPRALYGLAVATVLKGEAEHAKELFRNLVASQARADGRSVPKDPLIVAWSHVHLGRIYDVDGNRELAVSEYRAALAVEGAPETARLAAQRGIEKGYAGPRPQPQEKPPS